MKGHRIRQSSSMTSRSRATRPALEGLEGRILMYATTGNHFSYGGRLTWSIEPDGTNLGNANSNLVSTLNAKFGAGNWIKSIQDAFAIWENVANINTVQVSDNGAPINSGSYQQGSSNFGDIRIGGFGFDPGALGFALLPPTANGGSDAGDIILNTNQSWQINNDYDLETVMIHEIGHALGLGHSSDTNAAMAAYYHGVQQYVNADDIAGVQAIWAPRQEDGFVVGNQNLTSANALDIGQFMGPTKQIVLGPLNVAKSSETYWFKVTTPATASSTFQAVVQSTNLSELSPRVAIFDSNLRGLWQTSASNTSYGATIQASIYNATPNTTYYVRVSGSNAGSTGTGAYALMVNMGTQSLTDFVPSTNQVLAQSDQGGGGSYSTISGGNTTGLPIPANLGTFSATVSSVAPASTNVSLGGLAVTGVGSLKQRILSNLGAWEEIHNFALGAHTGGAGTVPDEPDDVTIGKTTYNGDLLLTTPPPTRVAAPITSLSPVLNILIPLDPTNGSTTSAPPNAKKDSAMVLFSLAHPSGPF